VSIQRERRNAVEGGNIKNKKKKKKYVKDIKGNRWI
jgi:hypothetical protein